MARSGKLSDLLLLRTLLTLLGKLELMLETSLDDS